MRLQRSMEARTGRQGQRYSAETNARQVAACIVLDQSKCQVLLITSKRHPDKWVIPKGGWESDEQLQECALREAWEEAGVVGKITQTLGTLLDSRPPKLKVHKDGVSKVEPAPEYHFFEVYCEYLEDAYPEGHERQRRWMSYAEAREALVDRVESLQALEQSSIVR